MLVIVLCVLTKLSALRKRWRTSLKMCQNCFQIPLTLVLVLLFSYLLPVTVSAKENNLLHVESPDWRKQIIYFLMIDRFADGDPSNNNQGRNEYNPHSLKHFNGGDIVGVEQQLDYIKNLGATAVWLTPPVENMWYSSASDYYGYHGYWALDFTQIDPHFGTLADYQSLAKTLHNNDMYLIQDIVVNHTAPLFGYSGTYNPENTAEHFYLFETGFQSAPTQSPFDKINRLNQADFVADIYNWTTPINDHNDLAQQYTFQLANLADINTLNPLVIETFKETYKYWMTEVGVDAFRIDTVKYVEPEFWQQFLHDTDGIYSHAKTLGKEHFLTFGEVFESSRPLQNNGEEKVTKFLGTPEKPLLNSVIGFPLYFDINAVFAEGKPTAQLSYRLERFMLDYPDPFTTPNFVDNHDTKRFLATGNLPAFKQALTLLMTVPGIPVIYQGSEHAYKTTRAPLFKTGSTQYTDTSNDFSQDSEMYDFIQQLSKIRLNHDALTLGDMTILADNPNGQGLLAYQRSYPTATNDADQTHSTLKTTETDVQNILVLFNTAPHSILARDVTTSLAPGTELTPLFMSHKNLAQKITIDREQHLEMVLPPLSFVILTAKPPIKPSIKKAVDISNQTEQPPPQHTFAITFSHNYEKTIHNKDILIEATLECLPITNADKLTNCSDYPETLLLIKNSNFDAALPVIVSKDGRFSFAVPVQDLGRHKIVLDLYSQQSSLINSQLTLRTEVTQAAININHKDGAKDGFGPTGKYTNPQHASSGAQREILAVDVLSAGSVLQLELTMADISDAWLPANGFDNVAFTIFFGRKDGEGLTILPLLSDSMPQSLTWQIGHQVYGWGNSLYTTNGASPNAKGTKVGTAPEVHVDKANKKIKLIYAGESFGISDWSNYHIYITTWDMSGEGDYRPLGLASDNWQFGGAAPDAPKIMDEVLIPIYQ